MREYHASRLEAEMSITDAFKALNADQKERLRRHLGDPPNIQNVPQSFWDEVEEEQAAVLFLLLVSVSNRSARYARERFKPTGLYVPDKKIEESNAEYASERAADVSSGMVEGLKDRLQGHFEDLEKKARKRAEQEERERQERERPQKMDPDERERDQRRSETEARQRIDRAQPRADDVDLDKVFSEGSLETTARTEVTAASSQGEGIIRNDAKDAGMDVQTIWRIDPQSNVCEICLGLNGTPEKVWGMMFPNGPPAHPKCACDLEVIIEGISAGAFLPDIGINPAQKLWAPENLRARFNGKLWLPELRFSNRG